MKILTQPRLYRSHELEKEVHIADGVSALILDEDNILESVTFGKGAKLEYFAYFCEEKNFQKNFFINGGENICHIYTLLSSRGEKIRARINGELQSSYSELNMHIVSFISDTGIIDLDGIVHIVENIEKVEGYLKEENIFLGSTGKVRGLPTLLVHSNDVKASHACNMERISDEKLFYLRSRGLPREDATVMMLESYIGNIFEHLGMADKELCGSIKQRILQRIQ